jgi:hypothetical protein
MLRVGNLKQGANPMTTIDFITELFCKVEQLLARVYIPKVGFMYATARRDNFAPVGAKCQICRLVAFKGFLKFPRAGVPDAKSVFGLKTRH